MRTALAILLALTSHTAQAGNWYEECIFFLHEDHHAYGWDPVGHDASIQQTSQLLALCKPDMIQIHAKGGPGWTTSSCLFPGNRRDRPDLPPIGKIYQQPVITDIPPAPSSHVSLRSASKPSALYLQPQNRKITDWKYEKGRVEIRVPQFAIHQMVVVEFAD